MTNGQKPASPGVRNPITTEQHRREVFRQISLPLAIGVLFCLILAGMVVATTSLDQLSQWADISMIWLIIPTFFCTFLVMVILAGMAYLTVRGVQSLPVFSFKALNQMRKIQSSLLKFNNILVEPFLKYESTKAKGKAVIRGFHLNHRDGSKAQPGDHIQV
jgi:hypothetical protein